MTNFEEVTEEWDRRNGGERHIRRLSDKAWISVLFRMTGYGWMVWETAFVKIREDGDPLKYKRGKWDDRELLMVAGDYRDELNDLGEAEVRKWFENKDSIL